MSPPLGDRSESADFALDELGRLHLNSCCQDFEEVIFFPASLELLGMDTAFGGFLLFEEIEGHMAKDGKVFGSLIFADPTVIFIHRHIQHPMQIIFDGPMFTHNG
jgi:hypothetical protein